MATEVTPEVLAAIEAVIRQRPEGMTLDELTNAFDPPAQPAEMLVWLRALMDDGRVRVGRDHSRTLFCVASSSVTATPADQPRFAALLEMCVLPIVGGLMPRASTTAFLQTQARQFLETHEERVGFVAYALDEIEVLMPDLAERHELTAEQVSAWRAIYDADSPVPSAADIDSGLGGATAERPAVFAPTAAARTAAGNVGRGRSGRPASAGGATAGLATTGGVSAPLRETDLRREVQVAVTGVAQDLAKEMATTWDLRAAVKRAGGAMRATLTPGRALFAVVWACAVFWGVQYYLKTAATQVSAGGAQRFALIGQALGYATVPLCGLPWLGVRWWDLRNRDGLTVVDVVMTLLVGGVLGLMLANVVVSLGSCMSGLLPQ